MRLKIEAARRQLGTALDLYMRDQDPVSVHTLTGAAGEILEHYAGKIAGQSFSSRVLGISPTMTQEQWVQAKHKIRNALKHASTRSGKDRDDEDLLASFSDHDNAIHLFMAWIDYGLVTNRMPVEAQTFIVWCDAIFPHDPAVDKSREFFLNAIGKPLVRQKAALKRGIDRAKRIREVMADPSTEHHPLVLGWPPT